MNTYRSVKTPLFVLTSAILFSGLYSVHIGQDVNFDLLNYHFYNGYAFTHGRFGSDILPAGMQTFFNPLPDILTYSIREISNPKLAGFFIGAIHGLNFWFLYLIALLFTRKYAGPSSQVLALLCAIFGFCGPLQLSEVGTNFNDNLLSIFILAGLYFKLRSFDLKKTSIASAVLFGAAAGIKLTMAPYLIAAAMSAVLTNYQLNRRFSALKFEFLFAGIGVMLTGGFWYFVLYRHFGNPLFPFLNSIFHSQYYYPENMGDSRWGKTILDAIKLPFELLLGSDKHLEQRLRDARYLVCIVVGMFFLFRKRKDAKTAQSNYLLTFFAFSLLIWFLEFSYFRFFIPLEMLTSILIVLGIAETFPRTQVSMSATCALIVFLLAFQWTPNWSKEPWEKSIFTIDKDSLLKYANSTILTAQSQPYSFVIPFFPSSTRFIDFQNSLIDFKQPTAFNEELIETVNDPKISKFYLLVNRNNTSGVQQIFRKNEFDVCERLKNSVVPVDLCLFHGRPKITVD